MLDLQQLTECWDVAESLLKLTDYIDSGEEGEGIGQVSSAAYLPWFLLPLSDTLWTEVKTETLSKILNDGRGLLSNLSEVGGMGIAGVIIIHVYSNEKKKLRWITILKTCLFIIGHYCSSGIPTKLF